MVYRLEDGLPGILDDIDGRWALDLDLEIPQARAGKELVGHHNADVEISAALAIGSSEDFYRRDYAEFGYPP